MNAAQVRSAFYLSSVWWTHIFCFTRFSVKCYNHHNVSLFRLDLAPESCQNIRPKSETKSDSKATRRRHAGGKVLKRRRMRVIAFGTRIQVCMRPLPKSCVYWRASFSQLGRALRRWRKKGSGLAYTALLVVLYQDYHTLIPAFALGSSRWRMYTSPEKGRSTDNGKREFMPLYDNSKVCLWYHTITFFWRVGSEARTKEDSALGAAILSASLPLLLGSYMLSITLMFKCRFWTLSSWIQLERRRWSLTSLTIAGHSEGEKFAWAWNVMTVSRHSKLEQHITMIYPLLVHSS